jgi:intracellular sulfur oxidation DsrE/DsrF family protein
MMKTIFLLLISVLSLTSLKAQQHRIVWEIDAKDTSAQSTLMRQINNVLKESPDTRIEVVYHGQAITGLVKDSSFFAGRIAEYQKKGIVFAACNNSLRRYKIDPSQVLPGVIVVPVAILELVKKQEEGWSYIKM